MAEATFLVVEHEANCDPGHIAGWARAAGAGLRVVRAHAGDVVPECLPGDVTGLVVLGGDMGAYDDVAHPWLAPTKRLLARATAEGAPVLGVCLGHQLLTVALGGEVRRSRHGMACEVAQVTLTDAGREDPVFGGLPDATPAVRWNRDVAARLPGGAVTLAQDAHGIPLVVRHAPRAWGVQVHPEAGVAQTSTWGHAPDGLIDAVAAARDAVLAGWGPCVERFFALERSDR